MFKLFLLSLAVSTVLIFVRCVYRVVEFSDDFNGPIMKNEHIFIALESAMVITAILLMSALNSAPSFSDCRPPSITFRERC